jgi:hypothetical protein
MSLSGQVIYYCGTYGLFVAELVIVGGVWGRLVMVRRLYVPFRAATRHNMCVKDPVVQSLRSLYLVCFRKKALVHWLALKCWNLLL